MEQSSGRGGALGIGRAISLAMAEHGRRCQLHVQKRGHDLWMKGDGSRFPEGDIKQLAYFRDKSRRAAINFEVIIQPGASVAAINKDALKLLATTELYLKKIAAAGFRVILSASAFSAGSSQNAACRRVVVANNANDRPAEKARNEALPLIDPADPAQAWIARYEAEPSRARPSTTTPQPGGTFGTNSKGLDDLAGNVWEWTDSCFVAPRSTKRRRRSPTSTAGFG